MRFVIKEKKLKENSESSVFVIRTGARLENNLAALEGGPSHYEPEDVTDTLVSVKALRQFRTANPGFDWADVELSTIKHNGEDVYSFKDIATQLGYSYYI